MTTELLDLEQETDEIIPTQQVNKKNLPSIWVETKVGDLYKIIGGGTPNTDVDEFWGGDIPWITSADILGLKDIRPRKQLTSKGLENSTSNLVSENSLVVVTRVGLGKIALAEKSLCFSQDCQALVGNSAFIFSLYSAYYLMQAVQIFKYQNRGTTIAGVTKKQLSELEFYLPPFEEQKRIVAEIEKQFTRLDAAVESLKQVRQGLKRYRAAVLKAACEGRLVAQDENDEPASELLKRILTERRTKWEADLRAKGKDPTKFKYEEPAAPNTKDLLELPKNWIWTTFNMIGEVQGGIQKQPKRLPNQNAYPYLRVENVLRNRLNLDEVYKIELFSDELEKLRLKFGDLLIVEGNGSKNEIGRSALWKDEIPNCVHQNHIIRVRFATISSLYANYYLNSPVGISMITKVASSTSGLYTLSVSKINSITLPLPPLAEQERIVAEVERRLSVVQEMEVSIEASIKRAERLRQAILKRAFEGKLVPQDPSDEPASELLKRIKAERQAAAPPQNKPASKPKPKIRAKKTKATAGQMNLPGIG